MDENENKYMKLISINKQMEGVVLMAIEKNKHMAELLMAADTKNKLLKDKIVEIEDEMTHNNKTQSTQFNNLFEKYIELQETNKSLEDMLSKAHN